MRLVLARHGETDWNREGRVQGHSDSGLNLSGREQAEALAKALDGERPAALYSSPVPRARQTAEAVAAACGLPVLTLEALAEADAGELDGMPAAEMHRRYPDFMEQWRRDPATAVMPGGESVAQVQERVWGAIQDLLRRHKEETVVVVSHNFAIKALLCRALGVPLRHFNRFRMDLGAWSMLEFGERGAVLRRHNNPSCCSADISRKG